MPQAPQAGTCKLDGDSLKGLNLCYDITPIEFIAVVITGEHKLCEQQHRRTVWRRGC